MKKLFKILGYILLGILLLSVLALVAVRFMAPGIIEKKLSKDIASYGYEARVELDVDKLSPFGIEIPKLDVLIGKGGIQVENLVLDVQSLLSSGHELRFSIGKLDIGLSDELLSYVEAKGFSPDLAASLRGRELSIRMESPSLIADQKEFYLELGSLLILLSDDMSHSISTGSIKASGDLTGESLIVTPFDLSIDGSKAISFDEGIMSIGNNVYRLGHVTLDRFMIVPDGYINDLLIGFSDTKVIGFSSSAVLSGIEGTSSLFDTLYTDEIDISYNMDDESVSISTAILLEGKGKPLDQVGLEFTLEYGESGFSIRNGLVFHSRMKAGLPFEFHSDGSLLTFRIADSRDFTIERKNPSESVIAEMMSFILLRLTSSIFGL